MCVKYPFQDLTHAFDASGIWRFKGIPHLSCALCLISVKVDRSGGNRCVAQVVTHRGQLCTARQSMCGVRMSHPVWACPAQLFGSLWRFGLNDVGSCHKKSLGDAPQPGRSNVILAIVGLQIGNERGGRLPHCGRRWYTSLHQVAVQCHTSERG